MSRIRSSGNVTTELRMVMLLRKAGLKGWRRHVALIGNPDFVWQSAKLAVFIDGCFWHGHNCRNLTPKSNVIAWEIKITKNKLRDKRNSRELRRRGWKVIRIWECKLKSEPDNVLRRVKRAITR
jgi:DNA mismatch endonuclease (patch repair protein)